MRTGGIPGTGHLERIVFHGQAEELRRESKFGELKQQRIRDEGLGGHLYLQLTRMMEHSFGSSWRSKCI
jgi:hypothetical protein